MMDSIFTALHTSADLLLTGIFVLLWLRLALAIERIWIRSTRQPRSREHVHGVVQLENSNFVMGNSFVAGNISMRSRFVMENNFSAGKSITTCTSISGPVLRMQFGYYDKMIAGTNTTFNEEKENAARFGMENLEFLTGAIENALGDNLNTWSVDIFVEKLGFFGHIKCRRCEERSTDPADKMKPVLVLMNMEASSGSGKNRLCRSGIFQSIRDALKKYFVVYDAGDSITQASR